MTPRDEPGWGPLIAIAMVMFIVALDSTMLNVAIPDIVRDLETTTSAVQSAVSLYSLVMAALMVGAGRLADVLGSKRVYVAGLVVFGAGTVTATIAPNVGVLILGWSLLEGIGAAALIPISLALISSNYSGSRRAMAFGVIAGFQAVAAGTGPIVGGYLATELSWRYAFGFEAVVVLVVLGLMRRVKGADSRAGQRLDLVGLSMWASGLVLVVVGVLLAGQYGWWSALRPFIIGGVEVNPLGLSPTPFVVLVGLFVLLRFVHWTRRRVASGAPPLFSFGTFSDTNYKAGIATDTLESLLIAGLLFVIPMYLQSAHAYTALNAGVALLPFSIAILLASLSLPKLGERFSRKLIVQLGTAFIGVGLVWYHRVADAGLEPAQLYIPFAVMGLGIGALLSQVANLTLGGIAPEESGSATGVYNTSKELGTSLGTAIIGTALLASFFGFFVDATATAAGEELTTSESRSLALELEDAEKRFEPEEFDRLVLAELPPEVVAEIDQIVVDSWTDAQRRAIEIALVVVAATFVASTFLRDPDRE